ncbi:MAG: type II toxin-antitoxin system RelE/ParE family toxin [Parcubacteria group bacterium]
MTPSTWRVFITPSAERGVLKLPNKVRNFIFKEFSRIVKHNPFIGMQLEGEMSHIRSYHFRIDGQPYRIAYIIDRKRKEMSIRWADYRGDFYKKLKRQLQRHKYT